MPKFTQEFEQEFIIQSQVIAELVENNPPSAELDHKCDTIVVNLINKFPDVDVDFETLCTTINLNMIAAQDFDHKQTRH